MPFYDLPDEALCSLAVSGDRAAEEVLVTRYNRLVRTCARPFFLAGGDSEDLTQEGMVGLIKAVREFDADKDALDKNTSILEEHLQIGNFGGFPSITIPDGFVNNLPVGLNITGKCFDDENIISIASTIESLMDYKGQIAKEVK